ncbi:MAG: DMT family transporter [Clostridia bacterium]|nr:DMT family transporter [Clostridia bacterium]
MMYYGFGLFAGMCVACMIFFNNLLSQVVGVYWGTFIYHTIALILITAFSLIYKPSRKSGGRLPLYYYLPGVASVLTVLTSSYSVTKIGLTLTIGLSFFGQLIFSNIVDHLGLFGMKKRPFHPKKMVGLTLIFSGVLAMIYL